MELATKSTNYMFFCHEKAQKSQKFSTRIAMITLQILDTG
jgi:hypothetical protein